MRLSSWCSGTSRMGSSSWSVSTVSSARCWHSCESYCCLNTGETESDQNSTVGLTSVLCCKVRFGRHTAHRCQAKNNQAQILGTSLPPGGPARDPGEVLACRNIQTLEYRDREARAQTYGDTFGVSLEAEMHCPITKSKQRINIFRFSIFFLR